MEYDEENIEIRKRLLNLPKFKASENFLNDLYYKINNLEPQDLKKSKHSKEKAGFWNWITGNVLSGKRNPWLVPALGFTAVLLIVFSVVFIINRTNIQETVTKPTTEQTQTSQTPFSPEKSGESLNKEESEGKKITEDLGRVDKETIVSENKYTDQGKYKMKTESVPEAEIKNEGMKKVSEKKVEKPDLMEQKATDKMETKGDDKGLNENKAFKKADTEKKEVDNTGKIETARTEKEKTDVKKSDKDKKDQNEIMKGANEIDKNSLKTLKEKLEKSLKP